MALRPASRLYLARDSFRRRRLIDAQKLLPIVLFLLYILPLLWGGSETDQPVGGGVRSFVHVFAIWGVGIVAVGLITRALMQTQGVDDVDPLEAADELHDTDMMQASKPVAATEG